MVCGDDAATRRIDVDRDALPVDSWSAWQVWLKRLCSVLVGWACFELLLGAGLSIGGEALSSATFAGVDVRAIVAALGATAVASAAFNGVIGLLGIYGAAHPHRIALFFWIAFADGLATAWALASRLSAGIVDVPSMVSGLFIIAIAVCAWQVRGQTGYFDVHP